MGTRGTRDTQGTVSTKRTGERRVAAGARGALRTRGEQGHAQLRAQERHWDFRGNLWPRYRGLQGTGRGHEGHREAKAVRQGSHGWDMLQAGTSLLLSLFSHLLFSIPRRLLQLPCPLSRVTKSSGSGWHSQCRPAPSRTPHGSQAPLWDLERFAPHGQQGLFKDNLRVTNISTNKTCKWGRSHHSSAQDHSLGTALHS